MLNVFILPSIDCVSSFGDSMLEYARQIFGLSLHVKIRYPSFCQIAELHRARRAPSFAMSAWARSHTFARVAQRPAGQISLFRCKTICNKFQCLYLRVKFRCSGPCKILVLQVLCPLLLQFSSTEIWHASMSSCFHGFCRRSKPHVNNIGVFLFK